MKKLFSLVVLVSIMFFLSALSYAGDEIQHMKLWQGQMYFDDRLFILDLQQATKNGKTVWAVITRRNVKGFPPWRVDDFETKEEAINYIKGVESSAPRISLGGNSPSPEPTYEEFLSW